MTVTSLVAMVVSYRAGRNLDLDFRVTLIRMPVGMSCDHVSPEEADNKHEPDRNYLLGVLVHGQMLAQHLDDLCE